MNTKHPFYIIFGLIMFIITVAINVASKYLLVALIKGHLWPPNQLVSYILLLLFTITCGLSALYVIMKIEKLSKPRGCALLVIVLTIAVVSMNGIYFIVQELF